MRLDLPLDGTPSSRFLVWVLGGLTGLAVLALALAGMAQARIGELARHPTVLTVALPPLEPGRPPPGDTGRILELLRHTDGVAYAAVVPEPEVSRLVEPWLGEGQRPPLPRLIDITVLGGVEVDAAAMERRIREVAPAASLGETGRGAGGLAGLRRLRGLAAAGGLALLAVCAAAVAWLTRLSLDLHGRTIELLRAMGAGERYVARQYELHALKAALQGGMGGLCVALLPLVAIRWLPAPDLGALGELGAGTWLALAAVPPLVAILAALAARLAALRGLARIR